MPAASLRNSLPVLMITARRDPFPAYLYRPAGPLTGITASRSVPYSTVRPNAGAFFGRNSLSVQHGQPISSTF